MQEQPDLPELPPFKSKGRRPKLSGAFMPSDDDEESLVSDADTGGEDASNPESDARPDWSVRSMTHAERWADPEYKARVLAKRRATLAAKGKVPKAKERAPLTGGAKIKSEKIKLMVEDEQEWMKQRLAAGAERRALLNNPELKRHKQLQRAEAAKRRAATRKANKAAADRRAAAAGAADAPSKPVE